MFFLYNLFTLYIILCIALSIQKIDGAALLQSYMNHFNGATQNV